MRPVLSWVLGTVLFLLAGSAPGFAADPADPARDLREAASAGDRATVARLLAAGVDVNAASSSGGTSLMYAAYGDHAAVVRDLVKAGAELDRGDRLGDPAIHWAAYGGAAAAVDALLEAGADPTVVTHHGDALAIAMRRGFPGIVESLARHTGTATGDTPMHGAARAGDLATVEGLLAAGEAAAAENRIGYTPLMEAAREGRVAVVARLLEAGADLSHHGNRLGMGMTALHLAADRDQVDVARALLARGLAVDVGNTQGTTPLAWALGEGSLGVAALLLEAGADPTLEDEHGFSALSMVDSIENDALREAILEAAGRSAIERELRTALEELRVEMAAPGGIVGMWRSGAEPLVVASGLADLQSGRPLEADDPYYIGSISKTYTAVVVLRLAEEGKLTLDDPVGRYLPSVPRGAEITIRQLLDHTSGLRDFYTYIYFRPDRDEMVELVTKDWDEDEVLALVERLGHDFDPGTDWAYSSTNYFLLGLVVERVTGLSLSQAYRRTLFEPLGLVHTWLTGHEPDRGPLPTGYMGPLEGWAHSEMFGELGPTTLLDSSPIEWGAGGLATPAREALLFFGALFSERLIRPETLRWMTEFRTTQPLGIDDGAPPSQEGTDGYGLGLIRMERSGHELLGHGGLFTGHTAGVWHVPDCDLTLSLYFNRGFVGQRRVLDRLLATAPCTSPPAESEGGAETAGTPDRGSEQAADHERADLGDPLEVPIDMEDAEPVVERDRSR